MANFFMAEDDPFMTRMYERAFLKNDHVLTVAHDGEEALTLLETMKEKPVVIALDVMIPKVSGFDVLDAIKKDPVLKAIPVVMLTNLAGKEDAHRALQLGAVDYLVKSDHDPKEIVDKILAFAPR